MSRAPRPLLVRNRYVCAYEAGPRPVETLGPPSGIVARLCTPVTAYCSAVTEDKVVALTYDDGPDPRHTPGVLGALGDRGATATFFVLVERAEQHPALISRILAEGHEVGLHGRDHRRMSTVPLGAFVADVRAARRRLEALTERRVRWYRPAYGAVRLSQQVAAHALGLDVPVWTAWARDWTDEPVDALAARAAGALHPGGTLLLHDAASDRSAGEGTALREPMFDRGALTRLVLDAATRQGYRLAPLSALADRYPQARVPWFETRAAAVAAANADAAAASAATKG